MRIGEILKQIRFFLRLPYYKLRHNRFGKDVTVVGRSFINDCSIGSYVYIGDGCVINSAAIGNYSCIAPSVQIGGMEHSYWHPSISPKLSDDCISGEKTEIGHDVWIAASAIVKQGVKIGDGAVIGANSFVNKDVPPYAIVVGSPAKVIKYRFTPEEIEIINQTRYWELPPRDARKVLAIVKEKLSQICAVN